MRNERAKDSSAIASKQERQAAWNSRCQNQGWSVEQRNRAASIIPQGAFIKVLSWPSL